MPLLHLSRDAQAINAVINHPAVRPFVGAPEAGELDIAPLVAKPENIFPFGEYGGFALIWTAPRTLEVHTFILPEGRGAWARDAAGEMIAAGARHGAERIWTKIPPNAPHVRAFAVSVGFRSTGETYEEFGAPHEIMETVPCR